MIAYHGDVKLKESRIARVRAHRLADQLIQGTGWKNGKGCAVGCTLDKYNHAAYETELGIPQTIARLEDAIFEGLPNADAMMWPEKFLSAIKPGADLSLVFPRFIVWLLVDPQDGVIKYAKGYPDCKKAIRDVAKLYLAWISAGRPPAEDGENSYEAAVSWASEAAWAAWSAMRSGGSAYAAEAAAWAAWAAMRSAGSAEAAGVALDAGAYKRQARKLIALLAAAKKSAGVGHEARQ